MRYIGISDTRGDLKLPTFASAGENPHPFVKSLLSQSFSSDNFPQPNESLQEQNNAQTMPISATVNTYARGNEECVYHVPYTT